MSYISVIFSFLISLNNKISKNKKIIFFITCFFVRNSVIGSLFILKIDNNPYEIQKNHKKEYCNIVKKSMCKARRKYKMECPFKRFNIKFYLSI